jgi:SAM-dependent methyltransferase
MWDERYKTDEYVYGTEPNDFLKQNASKLKGSKVLCLAEGEGRNAVYLGKLGFDVTAVDASRVGLDKAQRLATDHQVNIEVHLADLADYDPGESQWDAVVSIFCAIPGVIRKRLHQRVVRALKPGGYFLLEAYTPAQVMNDTGGGKDPDTMQTLQSVREELAALEFQYLAELERDVLEGRFHTGRGSVVQCLAIKPGN